MLASFSYLFNRPLCGLAAHPAKWLKPPSASSVLFQTRSRLHYASHSRAIHAMTNRSPNVAILPRIFRAAGVTGLGLGLASAFLPTAYCDGKFYPARFVPRTIDRSLQNPHLRHSLRIAVLKISRRKEFRPLLPPQYRTTSLHLARWLGSVQVFSSRKVQKQWRGFWVVSLYCFRSVPSSFQRPCRSSNQHYPQYLGSTSVIRVDWGRMSSKFENMFYTTDGKGSKKPPTIYSIWTWLVDFLTADFQPRASFIAGLVLGLRMG
jgi:hypothetical protein